MGADRMLLLARRRAALTQRQLAARTGVAQPTIARIELGIASPRVDTLDRLLAACGDTLESMPRGGIGVDRTAIRDLLARSPAERVAALAREAAVLDRIAHARRVG